MIQNSNTREEAKAVISRAAVVFVGVAGVDVIEAGNDVVRVGDEVVGVVNVIYILWNYGDF